MKGLASNFSDQNRSSIFEIVYGKPVPGNRDPLSLLINNGKITEFKDIQTDEVQKIYHTKSLLKDIQIL